MQFSELSVGQKFNMNGTQYQKTEPKKVSCCKTLNAIKIENNEKVMIKPVQEVELVSE